MKLLDWRCCDEIEDAVSMRLLDIVPKFREIGFPLDDDRMPFLRIRHCPFCGLMLPSSLRAAWLVALEKKGYAPGDRDIPAAFRSEAWWQEGRTTRWAATSRDDVTPE